jgi:hypothetical protein
MRKLRGFEPGGLLGHGSSAVFVPWLARKPVFTGHWFLSPVIDPTSGTPTTHEVHRFFSPRRGSEESAWRATLLRQNKVRYVWFGRAERQIGGVLDPNLGLRRVIDTGSVQVYEVP